ncbi:hypothetical protein P691DRAFT_758156 [Macrolepiota fuliginosa MF-IS2]|uniref:Uncharacterized protein n=1 Tax=Macrolepiota fuliginosa MF-IS2 TaxID=1400762 RepID=A0A9P6C6S9_9AGAR|nr:hypothetical protein P691DRAFT_758156 [Macrolepiota fuliginosa MF-IS2]
MAEGNIQHITTGVWKISDRHGNFLRDLDGHIRLAEEEAPGDLGKWDFNRLTDNEQDGFTITNHASGIHAWAEAKTSYSVQSGERIKWYIHPAGNGFFHISWPNEDFYWTSRGIMLGPVVLEGLGTHPDHQLWKLTWVGDF